MDSAHKTLVQYVRGPERADAQRSHEMGKGQCFQAGWFRGRCFVSGFHPRRYQLSSHRVRTNHETLSLAELQNRLRPFCEKHPIRRLEIFGSAARGDARPGSDVDLLVTLDDPARVSTAELLEMAGEAEEVVGAPVDFVLRSSLEKSPNRFAREHILSSAVCVYGG